jgi:zinc protease
MKITNYLYGMAVLCFTLTLSAALPARAQDLPLDPEVHTGKLANGLTFYVRRNTTQKKRVVLYLVNKAGSILETDAQRGLAHFMEHMSFGGSKHFPGDSLINFLQKSGVRFGADLNAYTSFDETVYQLPIPLEKKGMLESGLLVIRDWAQEAMLLQSKIDKERGVVLEEKRLGLGAQQRITDQTFPLMVNHSRYADRTPIGTEKVLKNFDRETILSFYKDWYRPDLQAIIVVGDIDVNEVKEKIRLLFSDLKNPVDEKPRPVYSIPLNGANQFLIITDKDAQRTSLQVLMKHPHKNLRTNSEFLDHIKQGLFNQAMSNRLQSISQKNAGNYLAANAGITTVMANVDAFQAIIAARPGDLKKAVNAFWSEISRIRTNGFTNAEVDMAKSQYLNSVQAMANEYDKKQSGQFAQEYVRLFLQGEASPGIKKEAELTEAYLPAISAYHLNNLAKKYILNTNRDIIITAPESAKSMLPDEGQVNNWFAEAENQDLNAVTPPVKNTGKPDADKPLIAVLPSKGKIVSASNINTLNITEYHLSNGVKVVLKPTTFANDEISFAAFSPGGTSVYPDKDYQLAANATALVTAGGIGNFSADALRERLSGKLVNVSPYVAERFEGISGSCVSKDLETALQLTYLYFTAPRSDTAAFNASISRFRASLEDMPTSPEQIFGDTLRAVLTNNSMRRKPTALGDLPAITLNKSLEIYRDRFKDASGFTFVFIGNFDPMKIKPLLEQYLGALPATNRKESARDLNIDFPGGMIKKTVYNGAAEKASVQMVISGHYAFSNAANTQMEAIRQILQLRMIERLREKENGVYSPRVSLSINKNPKPAYAFSIAFGCAPENVEKLTAAVWDEIAKLKTNGPSPDDLKKFLSEQRVVVKNAMETNSFWLGYLSNQYQEQEDPSNILSYYSQLDQLNSKQLTKIINTYLTEQNYIRVVLLPETFKSRAQ